MPTTPGIAKQRNAISLVMVKRKALDASLQRRVRARREASEDVTSSDPPSDSEDHYASKDEENMPESGESTAEVRTICSHFSLS
jgi:hypothetical protein